MKKIIKNGQGEYIEKKSKFIAHIFNVESEHSRSKKEILGCQT